jgi:hypothetical protein
LLQPSALLGDIRGNGAMAKGQKRSGREPKKPKADKKTIAPNESGRFPSSAKPPLPKAGGK